MNLPKVTEEHKESRRREIIEAAEKVFIRKGYQATTMKDIVDETGMSRGFVYMYFASTEEIFLQIIVRHDEHVGHDFSNIYDACQSGREALSMILQSEVSEMENSKHSISPAMFEYFISRWQSQKDELLFRQRYEQAVRLMAAFFDEGVRRGFFIKPKVSTDVLARLLMSFMDGARISSFVIEWNALKMKEQIELMQQFLEEVLLPERSEG